jgi:hypothetical protein
MVVCGQMLFDYKLREGVVTNNGLALMRSIELDM